MHGIDPPTLILVTSFLAMLLAVVLAAMRSSSSSSVDGMGQWALSISLFVLSSVLFSQQQTHPFIHVMLANALFLLAMILITSGMLRFYGRPLPSRLRVVQAAGLLLLLLAWHTFVQPSFIIRLIAMSTVAAALFGLLCWLPLRYGKSSMGSIITASAFGLTTVSCLLRMVSVLGNFDRPSGLLDAGAVQALYLTSFNANLLIGSVGFILMVNERLRTILEFNASYDALTGALNRGAFFKLANAEFEKNLHLGKPLSVALLDLDHFKQINDGYGHAAGDRVLQDFSQAVRDILGPHDAFGRYGGEEFVLLLPGLASDETAALTRRLRAAILPGPGLPSYTVSIGVAGLTPDIESLDELLIAADKALYRAKKKGRNRVEEWDGQEDADEPVLFDASIRAIPRHMH